MRHSDGHEEVIQGTDVLSSIPVTELIAILDPPAPAEIREAAGQLRYRDLMVVVIFFDQDRITEDTWIYIPVPEIKFGRIHEPGNWSPDMNPAGKTSLVFEYFCFETDPIWGMADADIARMTMEDFARIRLAPGKEKSAFDHCVVRAKKAYPIHEIGHEEPLRKIKSHLEGIENLHLIGRYGQFVYNNIDHSIETGIRAAQLILGGEAGTSPVLDDDYLEIKKDR
jgi:protoporphyrinogen oxidase